RSLAPLRGAAHARASRPLRPPPLRRDPRGRRGDLRRDRGVRPLVRRPALEPLRTLRLSGAMAENFVYFDLETRRSANDVGGWDRKADMGMSVGVTFSTAENRYRIYDESTVQELIDELCSADLVVGFNHVSFDYEVLMGYTILDLPH